MLMMRPHPPACRARALLERFAVHSCGWSGPACEAARHASVATGVVRRTAPCKRAATHACKRATAVDLVDEVVALPKASVGQRADPQRTSPSSACQLGKKRAVSGPPAALSSRARSLAHPRPSTTGRPRCSRARRSCSSLSSATAPAACAPAVFAHHLAHHGLDGGVVSARWSMSAKTRHAAHHAPDVQHHGQALAAQLGHLLGHRVDGAGQAGVLASKPDEVAA